jgi:hypothetical protein
MSMTLPRTEIAYIGEFVSRWNSFDGSQAVGQRRGRRPQLD